MNPSRSFFCLRHGATDWNREGRFQGRTDNPLNHEGIAQAHEAANRLRNVPLDYLVSSPLIRAATTAEIVASVLGKTVVVDAGIIECDFGSLEGRFIRDAMHQYGITKIEDLITILPSDGESWAALSERSLSCVSQWLDPHKQEDILFVCHDAVMQAIAQALCRRWFNNRHGTPFKFTRTGDLWSLEEAA